MSIITLEKRVYDPHQQYDKGAIQLSHSLNFVFLPICMLFPISAGGAIAVPPSTVEFIITTSYFPPKWTNSKE